MHTIGSFVVVEEDALPGVKKEEGEIEMEYGELESSYEHKETSNLNDEDGEMEVVNRHLKELEDIHQYALSKLADEQLASNLLPPGWTTSSTLLLLPPPFMDFYFRFY